MRIIILAIALFLTKIAFAFNLESKPINVVIPFPPGGGVDQTFRHFEKYMSNKNVKMIPIYKPGGAGTVGVSELLNLPADGYHVFIGTMGGIVETKAKDQDKIVFPVSMIRNSIMAVVASKAKYNDYKTFETDIKTNKRILLGYNSNEQVMFSMDILDKVNKTFKFELVPYKSAPLMLQDLSSGIIDVVIVPLSVAKSFVDSGKVNLLTHDSDYQIEQYRVESLLKIYPTWEKIGGFVFAVHPKTSLDVITTWEKVLKDYLTTPDVINDFRKDLQSPLPVGRSFADKTLKVYDNKIRLLGSQ